MRRRGAPNTRVHLPGFRPGETASHPDAVPFPGAGGGPAAAWRTGSAQTALLALALFVMGALLVSRLSAQTLLTQEEALALAFPAPVEVERRTAYLSDEELVRARALAGADVEIEQGIVTYYVGRRAGQAVGAAYFDAHRVRTKNEVVMVVVGPDARIRRVDVLRFTEPPEYRAPEGWIEQFEGRPLDDALSVRGRIPNITGATLTARALTRAARRVLALHAVIDPLGSDA